MAEHIFLPRDDSDGYFVDAAPDHPAVSVRDVTDDVATVSADDLFVYLGPDDPYAFTPKAARKLAKALKRAARFVEESA